ncbi:MAG: DUF1838 domain-containing protein [Gammaproteobacteria bacterium]|nr:DUF1838 domain-containing protein [Gammaproteobacteria bacterium]
MSDQISRRFFLAAAGMAAAPALVGCGPQDKSVEKGALPDLTLPRENLEGMLRMTASLEEEDVPWWFDGTMFGIVGENEPKPLVRFQGWEVYWVRPVENDAYELTGHTVTFFYDVETGKMLDTFANPYTGKTNKVEASVQGGGAGFGFNYSVNGVRLTKLLDKLPEKPLLLEWSSVRDVVWMHAETAYPPGLKQPRKQRQTMFAPRHEFVNRDIKNLSTSFTATVFENWPRWMDMGDLPGHVIWHASGAKIGSMDDLPVEFLGRLEREYPDRMTAYPFSDAEKKSTFQ